MADIVINTLINIFAFGVLVYTVYFIYNTRETTKELDELKEKLYEHIDTLDKAIFLLTPDKDYSDGDDDDNDDDLPFT